VRFVLALVLACAAMAMPTAVAARQAGIDLQWSAPAQCPDAAAARARLDEQLQHESTPEASASVQIARQDRGWMANIAITADEPFAARTLVSADCEALMRAAVLVIAVAIDPVAVAEPLTRVDPPNPGAGGPIVPLPSTRSPTAAPLTERAHRRSGSADRIEPVDRRSDRELPSEHALRIAGGLSYAIVPAIAGSAQLAYALQRPRWRFEALATYLPPRELRYDDGTDAGGRVQAVTFAARGCPTPRLGAVRFPICLGLEGGPVLGRGVGIADERRPVTGWLAATAGLGVVAQVHRVVALTLHLDLFATILRPALYVGTRPDLFRAPIPGGRATLGLEFRLR